MQALENVWQRMSFRTFESARRRLRRATFLRRFGLPLDPERLIRSIDAEGFEKIRRSHAIDNPGDAWPKYLNLPLWMAKNLRRVRELELDGGPRRRILDLGCGAGYFLYICQWLGHDVLGLDIDEVPMFGEMVALLGLKRVICRVQPFTPLPRLERKFDLITAFMICFNGHKSPDLWTRDEWSFFLDDLTRQLAPDGRICLGFNQEEDGKSWSEDLQDFFVDRGAEFAGNRVLLLPRRPGVKEQSYREVMPDEHVFACR